MIFVGLGVKNQFILAKTIDFSLLVQQKSSVESSINDEVHQKSTFKEHTSIWIGPPRFSLVLNRIPLFVDGEGPATNGL